MENNEQLQQEIVTEPFTLMDPSTLIDAVQSMTYGVNTNVLYNLLLYILGGMGTIVGLGGFLGARAEKKREQEKAAKRAANQQGNIQEGLDEGLDEGMMDALRNAGDLLKAPVETVKKKLTDVIVKALQSPEAGKFMAYLKKSPNPEIQKFAAGLEQKVSKGKAAPTNESLNEVRRMKKLANII